MFETKNKTTGKDDTDNSGEVILDEKNQEPPANTESNKISFDEIDSTIKNPKEDSSWNETDPHLKNYHDFGDTTLNNTTNGSLSCTKFDASQMDNSMQSTKNEIDLDMKSTLEDKSDRVEKDIEKEINEINEKNERSDDSNDRTLNKSDQENTLYSTAKSQINSMIIRGTQADECSSDNSTLTSINDTHLGEWVEHRNCLISFMTSSQSFYIQFSDFDTEIEKIQSEIDASLSPFYRKTNLCVTLWEQDGLAYRSRVNEWNEDTGEAYVYFIDFGNTERVAIQTITAMPENLTKVKPLCIYCKLKDNIPVESQSFKNFEQLVANEVLVNVKFRPAELERYLSSMSEELEALTIKLFTADNDLEVRAATLEEKDLWRYGTVNSDENVEKKSAIDTESTVAKDLTESEDTTSLEGLNETSYIRKSDGKDVSQFQGHDTKWFEKSASDSTKLETTAQCEQSQLKHENKITNDKVNME